MANYLPTAVGLTFVDSAPLDNKVLFETKDIRDLYENAFLYEGLVSYTVKETVGDVDTEFYHKTNGTDHTRGIYFISNKTTGSVTWTGLIADTVDGKHAYGIIDSANVTTTNPTTGTNITTHLNYLYTITAGLTSGRTWKSPVTNYADLATTYPSAVAGWSAAVTSEDKIYVYNGTIWVATTSTTPLLSATLDGIVNKDWYNGLYDFITNTSKYTNEYSYKTFEFRNNAGALVTNGTKAATTNTDTFIFKQGSNITFTVDASTKTVMINSSATDSLYTNALPTTATVGGIPSGSTFTDKTMTQMWDMLLYPYQSPSFNSFIITGQATLLEIGQSVPANPTFTIGYNVLANVLDNSTSIIDVTNSNTTLISNISKSVTSQQVVRAALQYNTFTGNSKTHSFKIQATNTNGVQFNSTFDITWTYKVFKGTSVNSILSDAEIFGLTNELKSTKTNSLSLSGISGVYLYYVIPDVYGTVTFTSNGLLDTGWSYTTRNLTRNGVSVAYKVYRSNSQNSGSYNITMI